MRDDTAWYKELAKRLQRDWDQNSILPLSHFCTIELGLRVLSHLTPTAPASAFWVLLTGYPYPFSEVKNWDAKKRRMLGVARHLIHFQNPYQWRRALISYRQIPDRLRGYEIADDLTTIRQRVVTVAADRFDIYEGALQSAPPYRKDTLKWATEGKYLIKGKQTNRQVSLTTEYICPPPPGHTLGGNQERGEISPTWDELIKTAQWMDTHSGESYEWEKRLKKVRLALFDSNDNLVATDRLPLNGLVNLIGMVSSGKSTLMDILAVWASNNGLHVTLVVGDVISMLNRTQLFANLSLSVAPILGRFSRETHINRLHRVLTAENLNKSPLLHKHVGFDWLSSACPLDELLAEQPELFALNEHPCLRLIDPSNQERYACPLYAVCPYNQAQRDLVTASIWIATPASLIFTRPDRQLNLERARFTEMVYHHSDLVIVDEADRVQVQLDMIFSPHQTLVGQGENVWLNNLGQKINTALSRTGREQMRYEDVAAWCQAQRQAQIAADNIYGFLMREPQLQAWIKRDYFTSWLLLNKLADDLVEGRDSLDLAERTLPEVFQTYLEDPLGDKQAHPLAAITRSLLGTVNDERRRLEVRQWIVNQPEFTKLDKLDRKQIEDAVVCLEFTLFVAVLQERLNLLIRNWKQVDSLLGLDTMESLPFYPPPEDYSVVLPASPMGNVLGFQYSKLSDDNTPGELRFFRCMGVGRWWLLHLPDLFSADGMVGPHTLLMSGTSWAGSAPGYHLQVPVSGVLQAPDEEVEAIRNSRFEFVLAEDDAGHSIQVSGRYGAARTEALQMMLKYLAQSSSLTGSSRLENMRRRLPSGRQRIMLVVGSYHEARVAGGYLQRLRGWDEKQVQVLIPDDESFSDSLYDDGLRRGLVHRFVDTGAWLLIVPLLAVERGHNILNEEHRAALGAAYFLVRPHPHPNDLGFPIQSLNRWAVEHGSNLQWFKERYPEKDFTLNEAGNSFRRAAYARWHHLLELPLRYSTLPKKERDAVTWNLLVTIWQLIGRLIRGGSPARIIFCDAIFAPHTAERKGCSDTAASSLLVSMRDVLQPYFTSPSPVSDRDQKLVQMLYGPFFHALDQLVEKELTVDAEI